MVLCAITARFVLICCAGQIGHEGVGSPSDAAAAEPSRRVALFADTHFQQGFHLSLPSSKMGWQVAAVLKPEEARGEPVWRLCQWGTRHSLAGVKPTDTDGDTVFENRAKRVVVGREGSASRDLILEIRASTEYDRARRQGEAWPHLLVEQNARQKVPLSQVASLDLSVDLKLLYVRSHMGADYDPGLHTAQLQLFLIVKNIDRTSADFGDFLWFGVPFFDQRHEFPIGHQARDAGKDDASGKFIYTIPGRDILPEPMRPGRWIRVAKDLRPAVLEALKTAVARRFLGTADPMQYSVVNINFGWELPGSFDAAVQVRDFMLSAEFEVLQAGPIGTCRSTVPARPGPRTSRRGDARLGGRWNR